MYKYANMPGKIVTITSTNHCCSQKAQWAKTLNLRDALTRSVMGVFDCHNFMRVGGGLNDPLPETGNNVCPIIRKIIHAIRSLVRQSIQKLRSLPVKRQQICAFHLFD